MQELPLAPVQVRASAQEQGPALPPVPLLHIPPRLHRYRAPAHLLAARPTAWAQVQLPAEAQVQLPAEAQVREQALAQTVQALPAAVVPVPGLGQGPERALPPPAPAARVAEEHVALRHAPSASSSSPPHSSDSEGRRPQ